MTEIEIFTSDRIDYLKHDIKRFLHKFESPDYEIKFSTTPMIANGSSAGITYSALVVIK